MPPVSSSGLLDGTGVPRTSAEERAARVRFRRAMALMVMTLAVPGSAQLAAGNRRVGLLALRVWLGLLATAFLLLLVALLRREWLFSLVSDTGLLLALRLGLIVGAVAWGALFLDAWRIGQPLTLGLAHRRAVVGVNGFLCLSVIGTLLFGAHLVGVARDGILTMFGATTVSGAYDGRFNVLLLGGDAGAGRWGLRPDSLTVASIDAETGRAVLIGLPRNMASFPFAEGSVMAEQFPQGFDCDGCYLNGVSTWAQDNAELFPGVADPGVEATVSAVEGITDLRVNYWVMVNLQGFRDLVDAVGGVTLNVRQPIPVGLPGEPAFHYLETGVRKLNGHDTLWYARAREGSDDYSRMARQKCVMSAMLQQVSPQVAVRNFERIAAASTAMVSTNLPASELDTFMSLALKAREEKVSTLSLVPPMIDTADPDIALVRRKVDQAIEKAEGTATAGPKRKPRPTPDAVTGGSIGSLSQGYAANQAEDLAAAC